MTDAGAQATPDLTKAVPICLQLGWTMAVLYSILHRAADEHPATPDDPQAADPGWDRLQSEHELDARDRVNLEMTRLISLVSGLNGAGSAYQAKFMPKTTLVTEAWWDADPGTALTPPSEGDFPTRAKALKDVLSAFHLSVLTEFTKCGPEAGLGYQVGRSLRDSVNPAASRHMVSPAVNQPPAGAGGGGGAADGGATHQVDAGDVAVNRMQNGLGRDRVAVIQKWLATLAPQFPANAAKIVSSSLGRWSDFAYVTLEDGGPGRLRRDGTGTKKKATAQDMVKLLLKQGDVWLGLLVGEQTTKALLSPEGFVAAGDAALRRTARIISKVLWRYKWAFLVLLLALAAALAGAAVYLGGASKVWTSIAAVASAMGVTYKGIGAAIPKLAEDAEKPIFGLEQVEAMAWSITSLPEVNATQKGVRYLRTTGTAPEGPLGSF